MIFVYQELGVSALAGVAVLVAMVPLIAIIGKLGEILQRSQLKAKDSRIKVCIRLYITKYIIFFVINSIT